MHSMAAQELAAMGCTIRCALLHKVDVRQTLREKENPFFRGKTHTICKVNLMGIKQD
jgi:hypothetical protein